ncbi:hypothetical protein ACQ4PT_009932 [Festuca glaucescens]
MSAAATSTPEAATSAAVGEEARKEAEDVVVQYVVLRRDLADVWPMGSVVAQGCHAAVAAVWAHRDHPDTAAYCAPDNLDRMHKACSTFCLTQLCVSLHCSAIFSIFLAPLEIVNFIAIPSNDSMRLHIVLPI